MSSRGWHLIQVDLDECLARVYEQKSTLDIPECALLDAVAGREHEVRPVLVIVNAAKRNHAISHVT